MTKTYKPHDRYFEQAKAEGYRARSVYKLQEIQKKFHLVKAGDCVLDLGAAPGSFMQYLLKLVGPKGAVIGLDLQEIAPFREKNARTFVCDIFNEKQLSRALERLSASVFDVVTSDLAPATSGIWSLDAGRSFQLSEQALKIAEIYLKKGGHAFLKFFPGKEQATLLQKARLLFGKVAIAQPNAVRSSSREQYLVLRCKQ
ncbi:RlmE family RNA methyltransferase [Candidatus Peregrinibacteria bacterium]|nr:RlmE family RNA methyltransferase [Candidatus Peregrinibacteria bacterium]